jgi:hypothetical protein
MAPAGFFCAASCHGFTPAGPSMAPAGFFCAASCRGHGRPAIHGRDQVVLQAGVALGRAARSSRSERRTRGGDRGRLDRCFTPVGLGPVPVGGSGGGVFAGEGWWRWSGAESGAGGVSRPRDQSGEQARDGDLLPSRWNQIGWCVSGPLATAEHDRAAAGQTGEQRSTRRGLGHGNRT